MENKARAFRMGTKLCVGGGALILLAWRKWKYQRRFTNEQSIAIGSAPQGAVQLSGRAWAEQPVENLRNEKVSFLYWTIEKRTWGLRHWRVLHEGGRGTSLGLHDSTGVVRVDMANALMQLNEKSHTWGALNLSQLNMVTRWLNGATANMEAVRFPFLYRVRTYEIPEGAQLTVCGYLETQSYKEIMRVANAGEFAPARNLTHGILRNDANCELHVATSDKDRLINSLGKWIKMQIVLGAVMIALGVVSFVWGYFNPDAT